MLGSEFIRSRIADREAPFDVFEAERARILQRRSAAGVPQGDPDRDAVGLALSGGGVRSATFNLGILQAMERYGPRTRARSGKSSYLARVDYLSTVSGGGYIGSALTWFMSRNGEFPFGTSIKDNVSATDEPTAPAHAVRWLRRHGTYLTPGGGLNSWALAGAALRGILLNIIVSVPVFFVLAFMLVQDIPLGVIKPLLPEPVLAPLATVAGLFDRGYVYRVLFLGGIGLFMVLGALYLLSGIFSFTISRRRSYYRMRQRGHKLFGRLIWSGVILMLVGSMPLALAAVNDLFHELKNASVYGMGGLTVPGILSALAGWIGRSRGSENSGWRAALTTAGLVLILYGVGLWLTDVALALVNATPQDGYPLSAMLICLGALPVSLLMLFLANINNISMHRFYRDRLQQAYMPQPVDADGNPAPGWDDRRADRFLLKDIPVTRAPYHIVNTNMMTVDSADPMLSSRGGANFIFSPLYCGSGPTGYVPTGVYQGGEVDLATAFSISGAAVEPNTGSTRSRPLAAIMTLFNIRLGYWILNPANSASRARISGTWLAYLFSYTNIFSELLGRGLNEERSYVHLSDGGHFENLGLYELIRRKVPYIIACDAGADPDWNFDDLARLIERVRVDFAAKIEINTQPLHPKDGGDGMGISDAACVRGTITYQGGKTSKLLYIKSTLVSGLPEDIYGYKRKHASFPDEPTSDQFFSEQQFEAYRELGFQIGRLAFADKTFDEVFTAAEKKYRQSDSEKAIRAIARDEIKLHLGKKA